MKSALQIRQRSSVFFQGSSTVCAGRCTVAIPPGGLHWTDGFSRRLRHRTFTRASAEADGPIASLAHRCGVVGQGNGMLAHLLPRDGCVGVESQFHPSRLIESLGKFRYVATEPRLRRHVGGNLSVFFSRGPRPYPRRRRNRRTKPPPPPVRGPAAAKLRFLGQALHYREVREDTPTEHAAWRAVDPPKKIKSGVELRKTGQPRRPPRPGAFFMWAAESLP